MFVQHEHTHIHIHTPNAQSFGSHVVTIYGLRCSGQAERERGEKEESKESKEERLLPKGVALFIS